MTTPYPGRSDAGERLPVEEALPRLFSALRSSRSAVLSAPPGAGKTTRVPLALLDAGLLADGKAVLLEPRRLAARRAAEYMAGVLGEKVGETVGYRIRGEARVSETTRIEVVTEGILTRMVQDDPSLPGVQLLMFDEFHERSIHADLGLAFALDIQANLREDLRILVASATLDGVAVAHLLGDAPVVESEGRLHPVETRYLLSPLDGPAEPRIADIVVRALREDEGDVLVFLPGWREIRRTETIMLDRRLPDGTTVRVLHGEAPAEMHRLALAPSPSGRRKVILATSVAETSLTIDGVRTVVDSGLSRVAQFDPRRGMAGLVTVRVSRASADQRRGRAGRQGPGVCYRLWTERQHEELAPFSRPEIEAADLAPMALELLVWGDPLGGSLCFLDPPPRAHLDQARRLLSQLGAVDARGGLTPHGRIMASLPVHPRLAHMVLRGNDLGLGGAACGLAALLEERDILMDRKEVDVDLESRYAALQTGQGADGAVRARALAQAVRLRKQVRAGATGADEHQLGLLLALAYPERVAARRKGAPGRYRMVSGTGAVLPERSLLAREEFLAVGEADAAGTEARVFLTSPLKEEDIRREFAEAIYTEEEASWDAEAGIVVGRHIERLGAVVLSERQLPKTDGRVTQAMVEGIRRMGLGVLPWSKESVALRARSEWLRMWNLAPAGWPDLSDGALLGGLPEWLGPHLRGRTRRDELAGLPLGRVVRSLFTHRQLEQLDRLAPPALTTPTGREASLVYSEGGPPVLSVKLQEMFGQADTPTVAGGKVPVLIHLLSPAGRPLAVTQDLRSFWKNVYPEVRKEMRGRYPKHPWPEDPLEAAPTRGTKPRRR